MKFNKICPKCKKIGIEIWHFHEPDHLGIQAVIFHNEEMISTIFGEHKRFKDSCYLTELEYQTINFK